MQVGLSIGRRKKVFTIIPEIRLYETPTEQNQSIQERRAKIIKTIDNMVGSSYRRGTFCRGSYVIEKVFLNGELIAMDYVCRPL